MKIKINEWMKDWLSIYANKCNACSRFCKSVLFWPEIASSCWQIALNNITGIATSRYIFLLRLFCLSLPFLAFCVQLFAQWESSVAVSKYSRLSGNPEELLKNDAMGGLGIHWLLAALTRGRGYQRGERGHSTAISTNAFSMFWP